MSSIQDTIEVDDRIGAQTVPTPLEIAEELERSFWDVTHVAFDLNAIARDDLPYELDKVGKTALIDRLVDRLTAVGERLSLTESAINPKVADID